MSFSIKISNNQLSKEYDVLLYAKQQALKSLYHDVGEMYKQYIREVLPTDTGSVYKAFKYRVRPTKYDIKFSAGILFDQDYQKIAKYFNWLLIGSRPHWVSLKAHPKLADWAVRNNVVTKDGDAYYSTRYKSYTKKGIRKQTRAIEVSSKPIEHYISKIRIRILKDLISEIQSLM